MCGISKGVYLCEKWDNLEALRRYMCPCAPKKPLHVGVNKARDMYNKQASTQEKHIQGDNKVVTGRSVGTYRARMGSRKTVLQRKWVCKLVVMRCTLWVGVRSSPEFGPKIETDGRDVPVDRALVVIEAAFVEGLYFGILVIVCFAEQGRCAGHLWLLA